MRLSVAERETFRKAVKNLISQFKKSEVDEHFTKQGIAQSRIYKTITRMQIGGPIKDNKKTGHSTKWTGAKKKQLKRLANNRTGVSQRRIGRKFDVHQTTVGRKIKKWV